MRQNSFTEKLGLAGPVITPDFKHDVRATSRAIFLNTGYAFVGRAGNRANFAQHSIGDRFGRGFAAAFFHGIGNRLTLFKSETSALEENVGRTSDVLYLVGEIHCRLFASAFLALSRITAHTADDDRAEHQVGQVLPRFASALFEILERVANKRRRGD